MSMLQYPRASSSILAKNGHNNGGSGENACLLDECAQDGREEGGEDDSFLYFGISLSA